VRALRSADGDIGKPKLDFEPTRIELMTPLQWSPARREARRTPFAMRHFAPLIALLIWGCVARPEPSSADQRPSDTSVAGAPQTDGVGAQGVTPNAGGQSTGGQGAAGTGRSQPAAAGDVIPEPEDEASSVFDQDVVRVYDITVPAADLAVLDQNPAAETYVAGSLSVDGDPVGPIGFRYKGSLGAFLSPCTKTTTVAAATGAKTGKCSIKVAFDFIDPEARYRGLKKLNLHSMNNDPSMLRDRLAYSLFREMGIPASRAMHARVNINGKFEGLFVAVEQVDGRFTRSHFTEGGKGNLYKEVWPMHGAAEDYRAALETNEDANPPLDRMVEFAKASQQGSAAVESYVDRMYMARYLATDRVIANDDGSAHWWCMSAGQGNNPGGIGNHNYYWYEAELAPRFWLIPWDLDSSLGATNYVRIQPEWRTVAPCTCAGNPAQRPTSCDPLFSIWADWKAEYESAVDAFLSGPFEPSRVEQKLASWSAQIQPVVSEAAGLNGAPTEAGWQGAVAFLRLAIDSLRQNRGVTTR
jgi:spore coat protein H